MIDIIILYNIHDSIVHYIQHNEHHYKIDCKIFKVNKNMYIKERMFKF